MDFIYALWTNYGIPAIVISALAWVLTYAVKVPYKLLTVLIKDDDFRHLANIPIAFIPIGVGIGLWYLYSYIFTAIGAIDQMLIAGIFCGVGALLIYFAFGARLEAALKKIIKNKKVAAAVCSTDEEKADMQEIVDTVKKSKDPVSDTKKLFAKKVKAVAPDDALAAAKKAYAEITKK